MAEATQTTTDTGTGTAAATATVIDATAQGTATTQVTTGTGTQAASAVPAPATSWRDAITNKEHRAIADRYNSPADLAQAQYEATKALSSTLRVPNKDAKPEEWAAYRAKIGVPEKPDGYKFEVPAGREPSEADKAFQGVMANVFHAQNLTAEQAAGLNKAYNDVVVQAQEAQVAQDKKYAEASMETLKAKWGSEFPQNLTYANRMVAHAFGDTLEAARQLTTSDGQFVLDHPVFIEAFARFGREMREDGLNGASMNDSEAASLKGEIEKANADFYKAYQSGDRQAAAEIDKKRAALYSKMHGSGPIVGASGRAL